MCPETKSGDTSGLERLELLSAAPRATLTPLSCSQNFPHP